MDVVFNLSVGLETRTINSHFKLQEDQFWIALASLGLQLWVKVVALNFDDARVRINAERIS